MLKNAIFKFERSLGVGHGAQRHGPAGGGEGHADAPGALFAEAVEQVNDGVYRDSHEDRDANKVDHRYLNLKQCHARARPAQAGDEGADSASSARAT